VQLLGAFPRARVTGLPGCLALALGVDLGPDEHRQPREVQPMTSAASEDPADRVVADVTAWLKTLDAPGGSALFRPLTSRCTVPGLTCVSLARPSRAISAGNKARNQW
jgi:hypothetical protein